MESIVSYCAGIDVDKSTLKVSFVAKMVNNEIKVKASKTFKNNETGFKELFEWQKKHYKVTTAPCSFLMEATGVYHENLAYFLYEKDLTVHVVLATKAKKYMQSLGIRSKNDKIDAKGLATMGVQQQLDKWAPFSSNTYTLRSLTRQVEALQKSKTEFNNRLHAAETSAAKEDDFVIKSLQSVIIKLEREIAACQKRVEECIVEDKELNSKYQLYDGIKGLGIMTFAVVAAETNGFKLIKNQGQLVSYSGYDVVENASGSRVGKTKISKKGNSHIRRIMHMASLNVVRNDVKVFKNLKERVEEKTKVKMKGYVAVQRKLLCLIYFLWKRNEAFDPEYKNISLEKEPKLLFSGSSERTEKKEAVPESPVLH